MEGAARATPAVNSSEFSDSEDEFECTDEDLLYDFVGNCRKYSTPVVLKKLSELLSRSTVVASDGKSGDLVWVCKALPRTIRRCLDEVVVAEFHPDQEEFRAQVFEVLSGLADFTVAFLSDYVGSPSNQTLMRPSLKNTLEAINLALNSKMWFYTRSGENNREILVLPSRLECALRVPGYIVKVCGDTDDKTYYFCAHEGVNELGVTCECCTRPSQANAILVNVCCQFAKSARGSVYECLLKIISTYEEPSLELMNLLLRPVVGVLEYSIEDKSWSVVLDRCFSEIGMLSICQNAYQKVCQNLTNALKCHPNALGSHNSVIETLSHLHTISRWSISCPGDCLCADGTVLSFEDPSHLQILFLEREVLPGGPRGFFEVLQDFRDGGCIQGSGNYVPFMNCTLQWLKKERVILRWLMKYHTVADTVKEIIQFVEFVGKEGLVLQQEEFVTIIKYDLVSEHVYVNNRSLKRTYAQPQVVAAILVNFNLGPYFPEFMNGVCNWLERWQGQGSAVTSRMVHSILEKLIPNDKDRKLENRLLNILWNQACSLPASDFVGCLRRIACHYTSMTEPNILFLPSEETQNFLQSCSSADKEVADYRNMGIKFEEKAEYNRRAKVYQDMEVNYNFKTSLQLKHVLNIDIPLTCHETSKECLKRLDQAQKLISTCKSSTSKHIESVMASSMAPELQAFEAVKKEIALRFTLRQKMQQANERHLREYDAMKDKHNKRLKKFFDACLQEKETIVKDALYAKAKVIAAVDMANLNPSMQFCSDDMLKRMMQKTESTLEEVETKYKKSLEIAPNSECNVCFVDFSLKRKRACFDPCGHTGTCFDCGMQQWKKTKKCSLCRSATSKPVAVPSKLFFG